MVDMGGKRGAASLRDKVAAGLVNDETAQAQTQPVDRGKQGISLARLDPAIGLAN
jgi:hypothetical protein